MPTRSDDPESGSELFYSCRSGHDYTEPLSAGPNVNLGGGWALGPSVSATDPGVVSCGNAARAIRLPKLYRRACF
jgi:hypothetical protein